MKLNRQFNRMDFLLTLTAIIFLCLSIFNISGWLMDDDEGTDFYEVWQLQLGQQPGVDYVAEQQPLFLQLGKIIVEEFGRSPTALRIPATLQLLVGSFVLTFVIRKVWGSKIALISLILLLCSPTVFEQARLFRPDPIMLGWEMVGLATAILAVSEKKRFWWLFSGSFYGISILWKLFGVFPVVGLAFYFVFSLWSKRKQPSEIKSILLDGIYFSAMFLLFSLGASLILYNQMGFYYGEAFQNHLESGQVGTILDIISRPILFFLLLIIWFNPHFSFLPVLSILNRKKSNITALAENKLLLFQLLTPTIFFFISRPIHFRYFLHIFPAMAILLGLQLDLTINFFKSQIHSKRVIQLAPVYFGIGFLVLLIQPGFSKLLTRHESDSIALANLVQSRTQPDDIVISDYAGINFLANRRSIYEASIIAGAQIDAQIITGSLLEKRIEETNAEMVLIHIDGGFPVPHQLVNLVDYENFRKYIQKNFVLVTVFDRAGQQIEVYQRP